MISFYMLSLYFHTQPTLIERGEKSVKANHVQAFCYDPTAEYQYKGKVRASMRKKIYNVQIQTTDKEITAVFCECPKGQSKCHHMAAVMLYALTNVSKTDGPCSWKRSKEQILHEEKVEAIEESGYENYIEDIDAEHINHFKQMLDSQETFGFKFLLGEEPAPISLPIKTLMEKIMSNGTANLEKFAMTSKDCAKVETLTRGQSQNKFWHNYRKGCITASNFGLVLKHASKISIPNSVFKTLLGDYNLENVPSIQWGKIHEDTALHAFASKNNIRINKCGFFMHRSGVLGASPDAIDKDHNVLVEIKCPYKLRDCTSIAEYVNNSRSKTFLKVANNCLTLDLSSVQGCNYYHQIQGQLYILDIELCYFVVWVPNDIVVLSIQRESSWADNINLLLAFFKQHLAPRLQALSK